MLAVDRRIVDTQAAYRDEVTEYWFANSDGTMLYELRPDVTLSAVALARDEGIIERGLESIGVRGGWHSVQECDQLFRTAARRAIQLLTAPRVRSGTYPVVLDPRLAAILVHEAIGHMSEADMIFLGLRAGDRVRLRASSGTFTGRVRMARIKPGNLEVHWPEGNVLLSGDAIDPDSMEPDYNALVSLEEISNT